MPMVGDEYFPTAAEARRDRERTIDPVNWVACEGCGGEGVVALDHPNDPDGREGVCDDCGGTGGHEWECETCGCAVPVDGYDCFACESAGALPAQGFDHAAIAKGIAAALNAGVAS